VGECVLGVKDEIHIKSSHFTQIRKLQKNNRRTIEQLCVWGMSFEWFLFQKIQCWTRLSVYSTNLQICIQIL